MAYGAYRHPSLEDSQITCAPNLRGHGEAIREHHAKLVPSLCAARNIETLGLLRFGSIGERLAFIDAHVPRQPLHQCGLFCGAGAQRNSETLGLLRFNSFGAPFVHCLGVHRR